MATRSHPSPTAPAYATLEAVGPDGTRAYISAPAAAAAKAAAAFPHRLSHARAAAPTPLLNERAAFDRTDYDWVRPGAVIPTEPRAVMTACLEARDRFGLVARALDLMTDLAVAGLSVVHPTPAGQRVADQWAARVNLPDVARQLADLLHWTGVAPVSRRLGRLPDATVEALKAAPPPRPGAEFRGPVKLAPGEFPLGYLVRDPRTLEVVGGEDAYLQGPEAVEYAVRLPAKKADGLSDPTVLDDRALRLLDPKIRDSLKRGDLAKFPKGRFAVLFWRKFDFQLFPRPLLYPVLRDLQMLERLRLTEEAATDGATQYTRLWTLGRLSDDPAACMFPTPETIQQLADMLVANTGGGGRDLIWGPDLTFKETSSDLHKFLGNEKFVPTLDRVYQGLGFPRGLTGLGAAPDGGDLLAQVRVFLERVAYTRGVVKAFVEGELELVREAFGVRDRFAATFAVPDLTDQGAAKRLLVEMYDRGLVGTEYVQRHLGAAPHVETVRLGRDAKARKRGKLPAKVGPYEPKAADAPGADNPADGGGRPPGTPDREPRTRKPAGAAWAEAARAAADALLRPVYLAAKGRATARQLTQAEAAECEAWVWGCACATDPAVPPDEAAARAALARGPAVPPALAAAHAAAAADFAARFGRPPTLAEDRCLRAAVLGGVPTPVPEESP